MPDIKIDISVVIPVYNQADQIVECVESLRKEENSNCAIEILLIDDGSADSSYEKCKYLEEKYPQVKAFHQENQGVSAARNNGIMRAKGKYIFFLDADDTIEQGTVFKIKAFFDSVCDEVDLVTYQIDTIYEGRILKPHFRYEYLKESGVYDLKENPYIGQTTMNIVVKNRFENNILFDVKQTFSEDQKYCCQVLKDKLKMGFCAEGRYIYHRSNSSASGRLAGACFVFEQCTAFFEEMFSWYEDRVPLAFQGLFVNDYYWKMCCNMLFPYHYKGDKYTEAVGRLTKLLSRCEDRVILNHPNIDFFEKYYMLRIKGNADMNCKITPYGFGLFLGEECTVFENSIEIVMTRCKLFGKKVRIEGFLKSVFFQFYGEEPSLCVVENSGKLTRKLRVRPSTHDYYLSHEATQRFWAFTYECDADEVKNFKFELGVGDKWFPTHFYFMPCVPFSHAYKRYTYVGREMGLSLDENNIFRVVEDKRKREPEIWLYYDCTGVEKDNGLLQFLHDYEKNDGIHRYYIVSDVKQEKYLPKKAGVKFGSKKHKKLFLGCTKLITAFIEEKNIIPFGENEYAKYSGEFCFEIIYLQHGVLHIDMPWKYTPEHILADRVVVSTVQEAQLFQRYGYEEKALIKCRMPRYNDLPKKSKKSRKILFAPSWRSYLVGSYGADRKWETLDGKFLHSSYYVRLREWLESDILKVMLEKYGLQIEIKLHPIFKVYEKYFENLDENIKLIDKVDDVGEYFLFITDFSSYLYDFLYAKVPVMSFIPDIEEFRCGMNGYHKLGECDYLDKVFADGNELSHSISEYVERRISPGLQAVFYENEMPVESIYQYVNNKVEL